MQIKEELFIENKRVDLYGGGTIQRTLTLNSLGNITAKQSSYSNTVKLPRTPNNILIFEGLGISGSNSDYPYKRLKCDYKYNSIPVFDNGYAIINSITDTFNLTIYNGIIELGEALKGKTLNDLNLSGLTHTFSANEYKAIVEENLTRNYNYAILIDNLERDDKSEKFGGTTGSTANLFNLEETFPVIKVEYIFNQIMEEAGFVVTGDLFDDSKIYDEFKSEYMTLTENTELQEASTVTGITGNIIKDEYRSEAEPLIIPIGNLIGNNVPEITTTINGFVANADGNIQIDTISNINIINARRMNLYIYRNAIMVAIIGYPYNSNGTWDAYNIEDFYQSKYFSVTTGDVIHFVIEVESIGNLLKFDYEIKMTYKYFDVDGGTIEGNSLKIGDTKQIDFIKDIANRYGLLLNKSDLSNIIETKNINNLLTLTNDAYDYSKKLIGIKDESFENNYAQKNYFKFKYGKNINSEIDTSGYYDDSFEIDGRLLEAEKTVYTSIFELFNQNDYRSYFLDATNNSQYESFLDLKHPLIKFDEKMNQYKPLKTNSKLLKLKKSTPEYMYRVKMQNVTLNMSVMNIAENPKSYKKVFEDYYSEFIKVLNKYKTVIVDLNLNLADIRNFDFFKLVYLSQTNRYYYCNKLKYNVASPVVEAELVEVPFNPSTLMDRIKIKSANVNYGVGNIPTNIHTTYEFVNYVPTSAMITFTQLTGYGGTPTGLAYSSTLPLPMDNHYQTWASLTNYNCGVYEIRINDFINNFESNKIQVELDCSQVIPDLTPSIDIISYGYYEGGNDNRMGYRFNHFTPTTGTMIISAVNDTNPNNKVVIPITNLTQDVENIVTGLTTPTGMFFSYQIRIVTDTLTYTTIQSRVQF